MKGGESPLDYRKAEFIKSAADPSGFIRDGLPQAAFAGRSNVGKSSVINSIVQRKNFARVGSSPGKTAHINYFLIDKKFYIVDLPGYGYAEVSKAERDRWGRLMEAYFASGLVTLGVQIVDLRHKPSADDVTMMNWFKSAGIDTVVVANKMDKCKKSELPGNVARVRETLELSEDHPLVYYSAVTNSEREALLLALDGALGLA